jgi:hypothetical protein
MSKKSRRSQRRSQGPRLTAAQMVQPGSAEEKIKKAEPAPVRAAASRPDPRKAASLPDLSQEYRYVAADLKRIGIIAAAILVIMIVLAIFLV